MRLVIVGMGVQGQKRRRIAGTDVVATVDPVAGGADFTAIEKISVENYDAACVCTPDDVKIPIVEYLLNSGKHVLVEKPLLAVDDDVLMGLNEICRRTGATCYTAYNHRFEPHLVRLKECVATQHIGEIYLVRGFYGNGTARDVRNSPWRDRGLGVVADLGSHLLDLALFCFGRPQGLPDVWSANRFENASFDHVGFGFSGRPVIQLEATLMSWRNSFSWDVYGETGSMHVDCLCKWGPSTLTVRRRVLPSGKPPEESQTLIQSDPTWKAEYEYFRGLCGTASTNIDNDIWINSIMRHLGQSLDETSLSSSDAYSASSVAES
tara:strand:+ start:9861 stop:10826 length:966 start_codon:yes stop_codon:yes gene_type:complete